MLTVGSIRQMFQFDKMMTIRFYCCNSFESNLMFFRSEAKKMRALSAKTVIGYLNGWWVNT